MLTLRKARKIIDQVVLRAGELNVSVCVAVCDRSGRLIALNQMDGCVDWQADRGSMGKAVAAAMSGRPSYRLFEQLGTRGSRPYSRNNVVPPRGQRGGLPIIEAGIVQGGCGVSGAPTPDQNEECARVGIDRCDAPATNRTFETCVDEPSRSTSPFRWPTRKLGEKT
jgi:uncharacterized protein GlcG (DUF336 family)